MAAGYRHRGYFVRRRHCHPSENYHVWTRCFRWFSSALVHYGCTFLRGLARVSLGSVADGRIVGVGLGAYSARHVALLASTSHLCCPSVQHYGGVTHVSAERVSLY